MAKATTKKANPIKGKSVKTTKDITTTPQKINPILVAVGDQVKLYNTPSRPADAIQGTVIGLHHGNRIDVVAISLGHENKSFGSVPHASDAETQNSFFWDK